MTAWYACSTGAFSSIAFTVHNSLQGVHFAQHLIDNTYIKILFTHNAKLSSLANQKLRALPLIRSRWRHCDCACKTFNGRKFACAQQLILTDRAARLAGFAINYLHIFWIHWQYAISRNIDGQQLCDNRIWQMSKFGC